MTTQTTAEAISITPDSKTSKGRFSRGSLTLVSAPASVAARPPTGAVVADEEGTSITGASVMTRPAGAALGPHAVEKPARGTGGLGREGTVEGALEALRQRTIARRGR